MIIFRYCENYFFAVGYARFSVTHLHKERKTGRDFLLLFTTIFDTTFCNIHIFPLNYCLQLYFVQVIATFRFFP